MITRRLLKVLFIPDCHFPYENKAAFALVIRFAQSWGVDTIVILGDFGDFYVVSQFDKDPNRRKDLECEIAAINAGLDQLDILGAKKKIYIEGNHEHRLRRYIMKNASAINNMVNIQTSLRLKQRGWIHVAYRDHYKLGRVYLTHDVGAVGRNAAHKTIDIYQHSAITGHTHRMMYAVEADGLGSPILSAQFGWLGDIEQVDYAHKIVATKAYVLGFGIGYLDERTGLLYSQPIPIINGTCVVEGKLYK